MSSLALDRSKFKIILIGDGSCGKTAFIDMHRLNDFSARYTPTKGVDVNPLPIQTNHGELICNIWDCAGTERFKGIREGYWIGAHAVILMFDLTNYISYYNCSYWLKLLRQASLNVPIVLCGNKADDYISRAISAQELSERADNIPYYDISVKHHYNLEKPILCLLRKLTRLDDLEIVSA